MITLVASRNQPTPATHVSAPARRRPRIASARPSAATASAASSLQSSATATATENQPQRAQQRRDDQRIRVEVPPVDPFERRVEQLARRQPERQPPAGQPVARQEPDRQG